MDTEQAKHAENRYLFYALFIPIFSSLLILMIYLLEKSTNWNFHFMGIYPRTTNGFLGIFTYVFIHGDVNHLMNNVFSYLVLSISLFLVYRQIALKILFLSYLLSGILLWVIGREACHIGASGLIYALAFFLFFSGIIRRHIPLMALSMLVVFIYGNMIWHLFPWQFNDPISWEGHLSGGLVGTLLSVVYRNEGPQQPEFIWGETEDEDAEFTDEQGV